MSRAIAAATPFTAIADPTRRAVLVELRSGEKKPSDLMTRIESSASALSQHLAVLLQSGLVSQRKSGRERFYRLEANKLREVADWVSIFDAFWDEKLDALGAYLEKEHE